MIKCFLPIRRKRQPRRFDGTGISKDDAFLTIDVSKRNVYEQEGILVTFKLYVRKDIGGIDQPKFPEFTGFLAQEVELPQNKQLVMEEL